MKNVEQFPFFVMLHHPNGGALPMVDDNEDVVFYDSKTHAISDAKANPLGGNYGFEIFEIGYGDTI